MTDFRSKRLKRIKLEAFLTCFLSLSTLVAASSATFAWFSTNKRATAKYLNIVAKDSAIVNQVSYHSIKDVTVDDNGNITQYTFNKSTTSTLTIGNYSRALGDNKHQLLIEIFLKDSTNSFSITANAKKKLLSDNGWADYGEDNWKGNPTTSGSTIKYKPLPLSFIVSIAYFGTSVTTDASGNILLDVANKQGDAQSFVTLASENDTPKYNQSFNIGNGNGNNTIYIMLDYNLTAIDSIYSYNIGNERFEEENVNFICDFSITLNPGN